MNDRFFILLSRKLAHEANIQELEELQELIESNTEYYTFIKEIGRKNLNKLNSKKSLDAFDNLSRQLQTNGFEEINQVQSNLYSETSKAAFIKMRWFKTLAICVSVTAFAFVAWYELIIQKEVSPFSHTKNEVVTLKGQKSHLTLSDGTKVWLNADSKLLYPESFSGNTRDVKLIGEAFFDVSHNKEKPFIIHTRDMNIKVLGTKFNVKAYPTEIISEAALINGSIEVHFTKRQNQKLILKPNEKILVVNPDLKTTNPISAKPIIHLDIIAYDKSDSSIVETAWTRGRLVFKSQSFEEIIIILSRQFDVSIEIDKKEMLNKTFTASFENETIDDILSLFKMSYQFEYVYDTKYKKIHIY
jgi:ferric-dicitrate binding protein FerR (iron transport regulator)